MQRVWNNFPFRKKLVSFGDASLCWRATQPTILTIEHFYFHSEDLACASPVWRRIIIARGCQRSLAGVYILMIARICKLNVKFVVVQIITSTRTDFEYVWIYNFLRVTIKSNILKSGALFHPSWVISPAEKHLRKQEIFRRSLYLALFGLPTAKTAVSWSNCRNIILENFTGSSYETGVEDDMLKTPVNCTSIQLYQYPRHSSCWKCKR